MSADYELRGVRLSDIFRDTHGQIWEVIGLVNEPLAVVRNIETGETEHHVIGCPNWTAKWQHGPLRPEPETNEGAP